MELNQIFGGQLLLAQHYIDSCRQAAVDGANLSTLLFPVARQEDTSELFADCIAIINVYGSLYQRGWRSYEQIENEFKRALSSDRVRGIVLNCNSPGGVANGAFDLGDLIYQSRGIKPTLAMANENAHSGAYVLASACDRIVVTRTASVGSVGVATMHVDVSKALERWGENITLIYAGAHKVDGNPYSPLPEPVAARIQDSVNRTYGLFVAAVARNRGMTEDAVRATEALSYDGDLAVSIGFADEVLPARDALEQFAEQCKTQRQTGANPMKVKVTALIESLKSQGVTDEQISNLNLPTGEGAEVDLETPEPPDPAPTNVSAEQVERQRIQGIMTSEHALGREELAKHLAFSTASSIAEAETLLQAAPKASATDMLTSLMQQHADLQPGSDAPGGDDDDPAQKVSSRWDQALKLSRAKLKQSA